MNAPGGEYKSWDDMTPDERRQDRVRRFPTLLARWRGGYAKMWELTVSLKTLTIRVERRMVRGNLHVACLCPSYIQGPVDWEDCDLEVVLTEDRSFIVRDVRAGMEVRAANVHLEENCEPAYKPGDGAP